MKYLIELNFKGGVHFGSDVAGYGVEQVQGYAHSDTIFSAIMNTLAAIRDIFANKKWVIDFLAGDNNVSKNIPFKISSFGFANTNVQNNEYMYYIPKPLISPNLLVDENYRYNKDFKKRKFISIKTYLQWLEGECLDVKKIMNEEINSFWLEYTKTQHLTDSLTSATKIYRTGLIFYPENIKPFFIVDIIDENVFSFCDFKKILNNLKYTGLGGRISTGCGCFEFSDEDWFCIDIDNEDEQIKNNPVYNTKKEDIRKMFKKIFSHKSNTHYLFSTYFPSNINNINPVAYSLVLRKGWFFSTSSYYQLKRQTCFMFGEGSVFTSDSSNMEGLLVDVTPEGFTEHKIYRCGIPFTLPLCEVK